MNKYTFRFEFNELEIDPEKIGRLIGSGKPDNAGFVEGIIEDTLKEAARICDIRAEFAVFSDTELDKAAGTLKISNMVFNLGRLISSQLSGIEEAAVFLCTAGSSIGETAGRLLREKDFLRGYILDIAGSEIAESAADLLQAKLKKIAEERGKSITNRYSPGYCGWNVLEQHKLFNLMPDNFCGISLTESALMVPVKSVSGITGIGRNVRFNEYQCSICDDKNCIYRRLKENTR